MAGLTVINQVQLGDSATATQNFTLETLVNGTARLARGNAGATTQDIMMVDVNGRITLAQGLAAVPAQAGTVSMVRLNTFNLYGSTNTRIVRFTNTVTNQGSDITYADSAANGGSFTINTTGVYAITFVSSFGAAAWFGVSRNSAQLTTNIQSITDADRLAVAYQTSADVSATCGTTLVLNAGDVIRAHADATGIGAAPGRMQFTITRVA